MQTDQQAMDSRYREPKRNLALFAKGRGCRVADHIEAEQNERHHGHRVQRVAQRRAKQCRADESLAHKPTPPAQNQRQTPGKAQIDEDAGNADEGGKNQRSGVAQVFGEVVRRSDADPGKHQQRERDAEIRWVEEMALLPGGPNRNVALDAMATAEAKTIGNTLSPG